jgi:hypothetical protein
MADTQALQDKIVQLMQAIDTRLNESLPIPETQELKIARSNLQDALDELALNSLSAAAQDVANAADDLQHVVNSVSDQSLPSTLRAALSALGVSGSPPVTQASSGDGGTASQDATTHPGSVGDPTDLPAGGSVTAFASNVQKIAIDQWNFFGQQEFEADGQARRVGHKEGEDPWFKRVGQYWLEGTNTHGLDGQDHSAPWSAAFISWVMKKAGAGNRFRYSTQHSVYIAQSIRDFSVKRDAGFWGQRLNECRPAVGDLVCWSRQDGVDYDHQLGGDYKGHSDIVVGVEAGRVWIIGGNVGDSVTKRPLPLDSSGFLLPTTQGGETVFTVMQDRISAPDTQSLPDDGGAANAGGSPPVVPGDIETSDAVIAWGHKVDASFKKALLDIAAGLACDPSHLMACMAFETGETFSPRIQNSATQATGLIQFMPNTAQNLGTSTTLLAKMSATDQLRFVQKYLSPFSGKMKTLSDAYMTILFPKAVGKPEAFVLFSSPSTAYNENRGLDVNNDGSITKGEAASKVQRELEKGLSVDLAG